MLKRFAVFLVTLTVLLVGCAEQTPLQQADATKKQAAEALAKNQPPPTITFSIERENITRRDLALNSPKQLGWVYLMAKDGTSVARFPVRGKVTSGNKRLTRTQMYDCAIGTPGNSSGTVGCGMYEAPDEMGTYGSSNPYIFFFTPNAMLVQWQGDYLYTSEPYKLNPQTKTIEYTVDAEEMAKVAMYKQQINSIPLDKAKGGQ